MFIFIGNIFFKLHIKLNFIFVNISTRLISEKTIEENILKKANQKRLLGDLAIEGGNFTASFFKSVSIIGWYFNFQLYTWLNNHKFVFFF